ncbi:MAG: response regulator transcription factor [Bacteroidota bacterium]
MNRILLAEDDENLAFMLQDSLCELGYEVQVESTGVAALALFESKAFDLCLFDVMMPEMDGFSLAQKIREKDTQIPILFLTARSLEDDKLKGFASGADDYITKPFSIKELSCRISVFLKRTASQKTKSKELICFGDSTYDPENLCYSHAGQTYFLTDIEAQLLQLLIQNQGNTLRREIILKEIWGTDDYFKGRSLDVFIARLRKYIKVDLRLSIKNHHGVGFSLRIS